MGLFGISKSDIRVCLDVLNTARTFSDSQMRIDHAKRVVPMLQRLKANQALVQQVGTLIDEDQLDRAKLLLEASWKPKTPFRAGCLGFIIPAVAAGAFFVIGPRLNADYPLAMQALNDCRAAQRALGTPIELNPLAIPTGDSGINENDDMARRALPVQGPAGKGRYHYFAEAWGGSWHIETGHLVVEGQHLMVVPCEGPVPPGDAEGRLQRGFQGGGTVRDLQGTPPVDPDASCSVTVHVDPDYPNGVPYNCRVVVACDNKLFYGASGDTGYVYCHVRDGSPTTALDATGSSASVDPKIRMDLPSHEVQVSDDTGWSFTIDLQGSD